MWSMHCFFYLLLFALIPCILVDMAPFDATKIVNQGTDLAIVNTIAGNIPTPRFLFFEYLNTTGIANIIKATQDSAKAFLASILPEDIIEMNSSVCVEVIRNSKHLKPKTINAVPRNCIGLYFNNVIPDHVELIPAIPDSWVTCMIDEFNLLVGIHKGNMDSSIYNRIPDIIWFNIMRHGRQNCRLIPAQSLVFLSNQKLASITKECLPKLIGIANIDFSLQIPYMPANVFDDYDGDLHANLIPHYNSLNLQVNNYRNICKLVKDREYFEALGFMEEVDLDKVSQAVTKGLSSVMDLDGISPKITKNCRRNIIHAGKRRKEISKYTGQRKIKYQVQQLEGRLDRLDYEKAFGFLNGFDTTNVMNRYEELLKIISDLEDSSLQVKFVRLKKLNDAKDFLLQVAAKRQVIEDLLWTITSNKEYSSISSSNSQNIALGVNSNDPNHIATVLDGLPEPRNIFFSALTTEGIQNLERVQSGLNVFAQSIQVDDFKDMEAKVCVAILHFLHFMSPLVRIDVPDYCRNDFIKNLTGPLNPALISAIPHSWIHREADRIRLLVTMRGLDVTLYDSLNMNIWQDCMINPSLHCPLIPAEVLNNLSPQKLALVTSDCLSLLHGLKNVDFSDQLALMPPNVLKKYKEELHPSVRSVYPIDVQVRNQLEEFSLLVDSGEYFEALNVEESADTTTISDTVDDRRAWIERERERGGLEPNDNAILNAIAKLQNAATGIRNYQNLSDFARAEADVARFVNRINNFNLLSAFGYPLVQSKKEISQRKAPFYAKIDQIRMKNEALAFKGFELLSRSEGILLELLDLTVDILHNGCMNYEVNSALEEGTEEEGNDNEEISSSLSTSSKTILSIPTQVASISPSKDIHNNCQGSKTLGSSSSSKTSNPTLHSIQSSSHEKSGSLTVIVTDTGTADITDTWNAYQKDIIENPKIKDKIYPVIVSHPPPTKQTIPPALESMKEEEDEEDEEKENVESPVNGNTSVPPSSQDHSKPLKNAKAIYRRPAQIINNQPRSEKEVRKRALILSAVVPISCFFVTLSGIIITKLLRRLH